MTCTATPVSKIVGGEVFNGDGFESLSVGINGDRIVRESDSGEGVVIDAEGCYVIPGLVDIHFHGAVGSDLSDGDLEGLHKMGAYEASRGIVAMCPATMTLSEEQLSLAMLTAADYEPTSCESTLVGINMEGPYISSGKVGAQNPEYVRNPNVEEFDRLQKMSGGLIKLVDIAPESDGADTFIDSLSDKVRISLAHTNADYVTAAKAFDKGASHLTHLYNAMDSMHHRNPGPIPAGAERDHVTAEIIADGIHIHPAMVRLAFNMFGDDRMILVSDTLRAVGLEDGTYDLGGQDVTVNGYHATISNGALAGSVSDLMRCMQVAVNEMGIPLKSAVKAATVNPAKAINVSDDYGSLNPGHVASIVILDKENLDIKSVILRGYQIV